MVKQTMYCPDRGDIVWLSFSPVKGHEQKGKRPALCISPKSYNKKTNLGLFCPITSNVKHYPFEVNLGANFPVKGVVLSDQVKCLDWENRSSTFITKVDKNIMNEVLSKIHTLL